MNGFLSFPRRRESMVELDRMPIVMGMTEGARG
jgi:hypothetical protein